MALQWGIALAVFLTLNAWMARHTKVMVPDDDENPILSIP
jgi:hypothetical protein